MRVSSFISTWNKYLGRSLWRSYLHTAPAWPRVPIYPATTPQYCLRRKFPRRPRADLGETKVFQDMVLIPLDRATAEYYMLSVTLQSLPPLDCEHVVISMSQIIG